MDKKEEINNQEKENNMPEEFKNQENIDTSTENEPKVEDEDILKKKEKTKEEQLVEDIEKLRDEKLRLLAEMDNLRKRSERDRVDAIRYGRFNLAKDILSPDDKLTRALDAIPEDDKKSNSIKNLIEGLKMVQKEFATILEKHGVKKIESINNKFDHNLHQAMVEIINNDVDEGLVIQEMQSGYTMHDRLLRPSMVGVSKKEEKKDVEKDSEEEKA